MSTFAWFDISTTNNVGILDAKLNDVLIRCLNPSQRFIFGHTNDLSSFIVTTDGRGFLKSNFECPYIITNHIHTRNNNLRICDGVNVFGCNISLDSLNASYVYSSNILIAPGGIIEGGDILKTNQYVETQYLFVDTISLNNSNIRFLEITNDVYMSNYLQVKNEIKTNNLNIDNNINTVTVNCSSNIKCPIINTSKITNSNIVYIQGCEFKNYGIYASNISSTNIQSEFINTSNITTKEAKANIIFSSDIRPLNSNSVHIQSLIINNSNIQCSNVIINNNCTIKENLSIYGNIITNSNISVQGNIACANNITGSSGFFQTVQTTELITPQIKSTTGEIIINGGGIRISSTSNLHTSNVFTNNIIASNIDSFNVTSTNITVNNDIQVNNNIYCRQHIDCYSFVSSNIKTNLINDILLNTSNIEIPGTCISSNIIINNNLKVLNNGTFVTNCPVHHYNVVNLYNNFKCYQTIETNALQTANIFSPSNSIYIDNVLIQNKNHMILEKINAQYLNVNFDFITGRCFVNASLYVNNDIECKNTIYSDFVKGYNNSGSLQLENIIIRDHNKLITDTLLTSNIYINNGAFVLEDNSIICTKNNDILIDINGKINGNRLINESVSTQHILNESITSNKIVSDCIQSHHLSPGLVFKGTCTFTNINLFGNFNTADNQITICGVTCSNSWISLGTTNAPSYPLHVVGTSYVENKNTIIYQGMSNNYGVISMESVVSEAPLIFKMVYKQYCVSSIQLATYPSTFNNTTLEEGDLTISTHNRSGNISKVFINESIVISSSNIGIWKSNPQAALHTTIISADKIGINGVIVPRDSLDIKGNICLQKDTNLESCYIKILDDTNNGVLLDLDSKKDFSIINNIGDVVINAYDLDQNNCNHIRIKNKTGYIGFCLSNPQAPLHINGYLRPGNTSPEHTFILESEKPSFLIKNKTSKIQSYIDLNGQYTLEQNNFFEPYIKIVNTNRVFKQTCDLIVGAADGTVEIGPYTRLTLFTQNGQNGLSETLSNHNSLPINVSISSPLRITNWAINLRSISITTTNLIRNILTSDILYTGYYGDSFYIDNSLKLIGIGTSRPKAAVDINSCYTSNVIVYKDKCILNTNYDIQNIQKLNIRGPFYLNSKQIFDDNNNIVDINNINFNESFIHRGKTLIDFDNNLRNINELSIVGPFIYGNKKLIDLNFNLSNINNINLQNCIYINQNIVIDQNLNIYSSNIQVENTLLVKQVLSIDNVGYITNSRNTFDIVSYNKTCFFDIRNNKDILVIDVSNKNVNFNNQIQMQNLTIIDELRNIKNIQQLSLIGPIELNNRNIITSDFYVDVENINFNQQITHNNETIIDEYKNIKNIGSISFQTPLFAKDKLILDNGLNITNINNIHINSMNINEIRMYSNANNEFYIDSKKALSILIDDTTLIECKIDSIAMNTECKINSIDTSYIRSSDKNITLFTNTNKLVETNIAFKSPLYYFQMFNISDINNKLLIKYDTEQLCDINTIFSKFEKNVIIGNPREIDHKLSVGGTIYADDDIYSFSDERDKSEIKTIKNALTKVNKIKGVVYKRRGKSCTGILAQDVLKVLPEAVYIDKQSGYLSVAYGNMIGLIIESIKDINKKLEKNNRIKIKRKKSVSNITKKL